MAGGIKDSSGDPDMLEERCKAFPDKEVFAGTDGMTLTCLRAGGSGIMSGASNIIPDIVTEIYVNYETDTGAAAQDRLDQIRTARKLWYSSRLQGHGGDENK